jgi:hypothetical protein
MNRALLNGFIGAAALTAAHTVVKRLVPDAPRLDRLGVAGTKKLCQAVGLDLPSAHNLAVVGDLVANTVFFSQVGTRGGLGAWIKGVLLGCSMAGGAVKGAQSLEVEGETHLDANRNQILTVGLYLLGGLAAAGAAQILPGRGD